MAENNLIHETSPYLLQHAHNPVEWYGWNETALKKAKDENKPIFLSIGYSSCHWCHVMAHESFENEDVAKFMNENFINIKVDREERPDIDDIYQKVCQIATGQGGWPLSIFLTPDQKPFYVGTYFPVLDSYGRPGFGSICRQLSQAWKEKPKDIEKSAEKFLDALQKTETVAVSTKLERVILDEAAMNLFQIGDPTFGGFGSAPKFPNAANISFMFRYAKLSGLSKFNEFALKTLRKMAKGGIFDQIGGGFSRYSTDAKWLVPHFEKMLYDNALIPVNYAEAYQITKDPFYLDVLQKTLDFVLRDMTSPEGGFYSAYDADSEGIEGKFYVWKKSEIKEILGNDADLFCLYFDVTDGGNWEGNNILCNNLNLSTVAFNFGVTEQKAQEIINSCSEKLLKVRSARVPPGLDDKILVSWNSLMITAFAKGYRVTNDARYLDAAKNCISFIENNLFDGDKLLRTYKNGSAKIDGYLEDYSYFINALLDVFEIEPDKKYLELALKLGNHLVDHFWDSSTNSFFMTSDNHEKLIIRPKSNYDLSLPSGNSVSAFAMLRLYHFSQTQNFLDVSTRIMESQAQMAAENPFGFGYLLNTIFCYLQKPLEITIINMENSNICNTLFTTFLPNSFIVTIHNSSQLDGLSKYPFFAGKTFKDKTLVFVCKDFTCSLPLQSIDEINSHL
ncbi:thioredoxin domain-containing protein [Nitrosopumilus zosterae]|uniref:Thioredoxin domain-containing protein n=1 Tax=Nitrosopumilus zosterae TaxID=718286 RepID=A0A2S2KQY8_9ARCH|nr:thioredoxin domain-containing protein [Nitrosopumilus zosterae]BDQ30532.1 thioredoxin domain-containing protein [Nitrosopumilus zosterae]GBH34034.1 thioredoxin domain-containing protein [Nitrosopumilus zosterae]